MVHIVILGTSGNVGSAVVQALKTSHPTAHVVAGVRDPTSSKAKALAGGNVSLVAADLSQPETLHAALKGADAVFINTPGHIARAALALNGVHAAKHAGVKHIVVVSVLAADHKGTIFGDQFNTLEAAIKVAGVPYTLLRLPIFIDNLWGSKGSIASQGKIYGPADPAAPYTFVAVQDVGAAAANILTASDRAKHANKTYQLTAPTTTETAVAAAFSKALGKQVDFVQVPFEAAKPAIVSAGLPEWQADGVLQLYKFINDRDPIASPVTHDIELLAGRPPTTAEQWVNSVAAAFK